MTNLNSGKGNNGKRSNGQPKKKETLLFHITLTQSEAKRFNDYVLAYMQKHGKPMHGLQSKIGRLALLDWLNKNEKNLDIEFSDIKS